MRNAVAQDNKTLTFAVTPFIDAMSIERIAAPFLHEVHQDIGRPIQVKVSQSYSENLSWLVNGSIDTAFVGPAHLNKIKKHFNIVLEFEGSQEANIWVRDDSAARKLSDLRDKTLALPPIDSSTALFALLRLKEKQLLSSVQIKYVTNHSNCIHLLLVGEVAACASTTGLVKGATTGIDIGLRALSRPIEIPPPVIVLHKRHSLELQNAYKESFKHNMIPEIYQIIGSGLPGNMLIVDSERERELLRASDNLLSQLDLNINKAHQNEMLMGIYPMFSAERIEQKYGPIRDVLNAALDEWNFKIVTAKNYDVFASELKSGYFALALVNAKDYWENARGAGYNVVVKRKGYLEPIILVNKNSNINKIDLLKHKEIAVPNMQALVTLVAIKQLKDEYALTLDDYELVNSKSHHSCLYAVSSGAVSACVSNRDAWTTYRKELPVALKVLFELQLVPNELFVYRGPKETRQKILRVLQSLSETKEGKELLESNGLDDFIPATGRDFAMLEELLQRSQ